MPHLDAATGLMEYVANGCYPFEEDVDMADLTKAEVRALGHAVGLEIRDPDLTEVMYSLNALLEALDQVNPPGLESVEPLPIILPPS
jgi:hypothetical protein